MENKDSGFTPKQKRLSLGVKMVIGLSLFLFLLSLIGSLVPVQTFIAQKLVAQLSERFGLEAQVGGVRINPLEMNSQITDIYLKDHLGDTLVYVSSVRASLGSLAEVSSKKGGSYRVGSTVLYYRIPAGDSIATFDRFLASLPKKENKGVDWSAKQIEARNLTVKYRNGNQPSNDQDFELTKLVVQKLQRINGSFSGEINVQSGDLPIVGPSELVARVRQIGGRWEALGVQLRTQNDELNIPWLGLQTNPFTISAEIAPSFASPKLIEAILPTLDLESSLYLQGQLEATANSITLDRTYLELGDSSAELSIYLQKNGSDYRIRQMSFSEAKLSIKPLARQLAPKRTNWLNSDEDLWFKGRADLNAYSDTLSLDLKGELNESLVQVNYQKTALQESVDTQFSKVKLSSIRKGINEEITATLSARKPLYQKDWNVNAEIETIENGSINLSNVTLQGRLNSQSFEGTLQSTILSESISWSGLVVLGDSFKINGALLFGNFDTKRVTKAPLDARFTGELDIDLWGTDWRALQGTVSSNDLAMQLANELISLGTFQFSASYLSTAIHQWQFESSEMISGRLSGNYHKVNWSSLKEFELPEDLIFDAQLQTGPAWKALFKTSLNIPDINGFVSYSPDQFSTNLVLSSLVYGDLSIDDFTVSGNSAEGIDFSARRFSSKYFNAKDVSFQAHDGEGLFSFTAMNSFNDRLQLKSSVKRTGSGVFELDFSQSNFTLKGDQWRIAKSPHLVVDLKNRKFSSSEVVLRRDLGGEMNLQLGYIDNDNFEFSFSADDVPIEAITPEVKQLRLGGSTTGTISIRSEAGELTPLFNVSVDEFRVNDQELGFFNAIVLGNESADRFTLNADLSSGIQTYFSLNGALERSSEGLQSQISGVFHSLPLTPFSALGTTTFDKLTGMLSGRFDVQGPITTPNLNGSLTIENGGIRFPYLGSSYTLNPSATIDLTQNGFIFTDVALIDIEAATTTQLKGAIFHDFFTNWNLGLSIDTGQQPSLILNTQEKLGSLYYGKGYITGSAFISGPFRAPEIKVTAKTAAGTRIKIPLEAESTDFTDNYIEFITTPVDAKDRAISRFGTKKGVSIDFDLEITPEAEVTVIADRVSGTKLIANGSGLLLLKVTPDGEFSMFGDYAVTKGNFNYRFGGLIDKNFDLQSGGTIVWQGDPYDAKLNLEARYRLSANPAPLLNSSSYPRPVTTDVSIRLGGQILQPEIDFGISFPNLSSVLRSEIDYRLRDRSTLERNVFFLLAQGSFVTDQMGISQGALTGNLMQSASGLLDRVLGDSESFDLGLSYEQGFTSPEANVDINDRIGVTLSTKLGKRVLFNGKLGVPVGGVTETVVAGDVELQVILNDQGTLSAKIFNRENTLSQIFAGTQGYTQGVGLSYQVDFENFKDLLQRVLKSGNQAE